MLLARFNLRCVLLASLCAASAGLAGCGSNFNPQTSTSATPAPSPGSGTASNLTAGWEVDMEPGSGVSSSSLPFYRLAGALTGAASGTGVTGVLQVYSASANPCTPAATPVTVTGTLDASGNLALTIPIAGGTMSLNGSYDQGLGELFGSLSIAGGSCAVPLTTVLGYKVAGVNGTWVGTLADSSVLPNAALTSRVTAVLTENGTTSANGSFTMTGTVTSTGACNGTFSFYNGQVSGAELSSTPPAATGPPTGILEGTAPRYGFSTMPTVTVTIPGCADTYGGALTLQ